MASETATVAGWMAYLTQNLGDAAAFYTAGRRLAREADDGTSLALSLGLASWLYSGVPRGGRGGPQPQALALLEEATAVAGRPAPAPLRALLWARRAEEHAIAGEAAATSNALERAEGAVSAAREPGAGMLNGISDSWLSGYRGSCAVLLRRPGGAVAELEGALRGGLADQGQGAAVMTDLAVAHAQQGDVERACELLGEVLSGASGGEWRDQVQRIAGARQHLDRWAASPAVRHLDQQLRAQFVA